jgi:PAS domain S-box-containing protein
MLSQNERPSGELCAAPVGATTGSGIGDSLLEALDESLIGTAVGGADGRWLRVNRAFAQIVGYAPEELVGRRFDEITHPLDLDVDLDAKRRIERGEIEGYQRIKRYVRKDGSFVFVRLNVSVARDRSGALLYHLAQVVDISERMRADEALRKSESNFRRLFDQASDGILISDVDGRYVDVNAAGCQILGYSREDLVGRTMMDIVPMEDIPQLAEEREQLLVDGRAAVKEWTVRRRDGTIVPVEVSTKFLLDGRQVAFVRDISERKHAEREREESLRWVRAVLEQSPVGLILLRDLQTHRVEINSHLQEMIGGTVEAAEQIKELILNADGSPLDPDSCVCAQALHGARPAATERALRDSKGALVPVMMSSSPIVDDDGTVRGVVVAVQDISVTKELERLRAEWSSVVAHDLRQPLATILVNAQFLARLTDDARLHAHFECIRSAAQRLNRMVDDLMDLSRLDARRLELVRKNVDLPSLVRATVERMALEVPDRPFDVRVDGEVPDADADPDRLAQVMENLLTNAVKYGTAGTPIVVAVEREDGEIAVAVTNDGQELAPDVLAGLFQRFQRTSSAKRQGIKGTGLGLYITRSLVEAHGGHIVAECAPPGRITFRFTLPVAASPQRDSGTALRGDRSVVLSLVGSSPPVDGHPGRQSR